MSEEAKQRGAEKPPEVAKAYTLVECDLIRCRGLIDAARDLALYRLPEGKVKYDGMLQIVQELDDTIEEIDAKLLKLAREAT